MREFDHHQIRKQFPILETRRSGYPLVYLDSAATAQKPDSVIEAISRFYRQEYGTVHRAVYGLSNGATEHYSRVREEIRAHLNAASPDEIIFTKGATEGINLVADSFGKAFLHHDDEILISATEHHANIVPWQKICKEKGAHLKVIPVNAHGEIDLKAYGELLSPRTRLVAIAHMTNTTGTIYPVEKMIQMAHAQHAKVLLDAAQSIAHLPIDLHKLGVDFLVFSGHKMYGPTGVGVLYGKKALLQQLPPYQCGGDMIEKVSFAETTFREPPLKFEAGTPMIAEVIGLGAALEFIQKIGIEAIAAWEQELLAYATKKLQAIPNLQIIGSAPDKGPLISFHIPGFHPLDIGTLLDLKGICIRTGHLCSQPTMQRFGLTAVCRVSFAVYNTLEEIDYFAACLQEALLMLKKTSS